MFYFIRALDLLKHEQEAVLQKDSKETPVLYVSVRNKIVQNPDTRKLSQC